MAMGNPASPVLANLVMYYLLEWYVTDRLPLLIPLLKLHVDDSIMAVPGHKVDEILNNSYSPKLMLTEEWENNRTILFL